MSNVKPVRLDRKMQILQALGTVEIWGYTRNQEVPAFEWAMPGDELAGWLALGPENIHEAPLTIAAEIAAWGRILAVQSRIVEYFKRKEASWKASKVLQYSKPTDGSKAPTQRVQEATYRADPEYQTIKLDVEKAQERHDHVQAVCSALQARKEALRYVTNVSK